MRAVGTVRQPRNLLSRNRHASDALFLQIFSENANAAPGRGINGPHLKLVDNQAVATGENVYLQKMREMAEWRQKMHAAREWNGAGAHEASADTKAHLDQAWAAAERAWRKLQSESAKGWGKTKHARVLMRR